MRCYFMRGGHICAVEVLDRPRNDQDAVNLSLKLLQDRIVRKQSIDGFELWDRGRFVHRYPPLPPKYLRAGGAANQGGDR